MAIDRERVTRLFDALGTALKQDTTLCLIGSTPAIFLGQNARQTQDVDVWHPASIYDAGDLSQACVAAGLLFDPTGELSPDAVYLQIVRPGIVSLPAKLDPEMISTFGRLKLVMPLPAIIAAAKLSRGSERDLEDVAWWISHRALGLEAVIFAIETLPRKSDRETASENAVLVRLVAAGDRA